MDQSIFKEFEGFELQSLEDRVKLPYILKDKLLMSPGTHNGYTYSSQVLGKIYANTQWNRETLSLFYDHFDMQKGGGARTWVGEIKNIRFENGSVYGDVVVLDKQAAINLEYGAKFGISAKVEGRSDRNTKSIVDGMFGNWSLVYKPADKHAYLNSCNEEWMTLLNFEEVKMAEDAIKEEKIPDVSEVQKLTARLEALEQQIKKDKGVVQPEEEKECEIKPKDEGTLPGNADKLPGIVPEKAVDDDDDEKEMSEMLSEALKNTEMGKFVEAKLSEGMNFKNAASAWKVHSQKLQEEKVTELQKKVQELQLQVQPEKVTTKNSPCDKPEEKTMDDYVGMLNDKELDKAFLEHVMRPESGRAKFE